MTDALAKFVADRVLPRLRSGVREEIRIAALLDRPVSACGLPCDLDAEQEICSAVLCGQVAPGDLSPLVGKHFYGRLFGFIFIAADAVLAAGLEFTVEHVEIALREQGFDGPEVHRELIQTRDTTPFVVRSILDRQAERVIDLWRRRQLIETMQRVDAELRVGAISFRDAALALHGRRRGSPR